MSYLTHEVSCTLLHAPKYVNGENTKDRMELFRVARGSVTMYSETNVQNAVRPSIRKKLITAFRQCKSL